MRTHRSLPLPLALGFSLATAACASGREPTATARAAASSTTYDFVLYNLTVDADDDAPATGFNLDGLYSTSSQPAGCSIRDRASSLDPDQNQASCAPGPGCQGGVDNVLPILADLLDQAEPAATRASLATETAAGHVVWLVRLEDVDSFVNDAAIKLTVFRGYSVDTSCGALFAGSGQFVVSNASLTVPGDLNTPRWRTADASIANGRIRARYGISTKLGLEAPITLSEFFGGAAPDLPLYQARVRATLDPSGTFALDGNVGGWVTGANLRDTLAVVLPHARGTLDGVLPQMGDLPAPGACGGGFGAPSGGLGLGIGFKMVRATIVGTVASPPAGYCGSPP